MSQHEQHRNPETEAAQWNSSISHLIIYTCVPSTVMCQHVLHERGQYEPQET